MIKIQKITADLLSHHAELNKRLSKLIRVTGQLIDIAIENKMSPVPFLRSHFQMECSQEQLAGLQSQVKLAAIAPNKQIEQQLDFFEQLDHYIELKMKSVTPGMQSIYRNLKYHLECFEVFRNQPIHFQSMDLSFYESLVYYPSHQYVQQRSVTKVVGLKLDTVGKTIKQLRTFLRDRMRKRIIPEIDLNC